MTTKLFTATLALMLVSVLTAQTIRAETPNEVLISLHNEAAGTPGFQNFEAARGKILFNTKHGNDWSCSSCHTDNPSAQGKHAKTGKIVAPLAPSANAERFTNPKKVEKWFKRNCNDVLGRACTAQEKGDVLSYLLTIKN